MNIRLRFLLIFFTLVVTVSVSLFAVDTCVLSNQESRRDRNTQPERVMDIIGVKPGMVIGEAGAGTGYFTMKLASRVGDSGHVYANDINEKSLRTLKQRAEDRNLENITTIIGEVTDPLFPDGSLDLVMMVYAIHDFEEPVEFLENLKADLKENATVVVLDQDPAKTGSSHFLKFDRLRSIFNEAGYELVKKEDFLERDLLCIFRLK